MNFPNDADGDALRRVASHTDITRPIAIDFVVVVPNQIAAESVATRVLMRGYTPSVEQDDETKVWTCYCTKEMVPTYAAIIAAQTELDQLSSEFDGYSDGWGTLINGEESDEKKES